MKLLNEQESNDFQPFTLSIRVGTIEDLATLWMMFNIPNKTLLEENAGHHEISIIEDHSHMADTCGIWTYLDEKLKGYNECK